MRPLPLLFFLLLSGATSGSVFFSATAHHESIQAGVSREIGEQLLQKELHALFASNGTRVRITGARTSSLDHSSLLVDLLISFDEPEVSRERILASISDTPLRLLRLSRGHSRPQPIRSSPSSSSSLSLLDSSPSSGSPCSGHGVRLPNATCVCDNFWVGAECDELLCFGGIAQEGRCSCPPGRFAEHCQPQTCMPPMNDNLSLKRRSIVVALNLRNTMARDLQYIIPNLGSTIQEMVEKNKETYDHFLLYTYLAFGDTIVDHVFETADVGEFWQAMQEVAISKGNDRQPTLGALRKAINSSPLIHPRSLVLLYADSLPSDSTDWLPSEVDQTEEVLLIEQMLSFGHRLVLTLTDQPSGAPLDPEDETFESLDRVTTTLHGDLIHTTKNDLAKTTQYFTPLLHQSENVAVKSRFTCGQETDMTVEIDQGLEEYYVVFSGTNKAQLFASSPDGVESQIENVLNVQNFVVFKVASALTFIRVVTPTGSAPFCSFRVFVQSPTALLLSFSHDEAIDVGASTATQGANQHLSVYSSQPLKSHKIQMKDINGNNLGTTKDLNQRPTTCAFSLQTQSDAACMAGPIHMKVWAVNDDGVRSFTRVIPAMCERPATRSPIPWTCLNGGWNVPNSEGGEACQCARLFDGAHCEIPQCHNGASRNQFPVNGEPLCFCQVGWAGRHCETLDDCPAPLAGEFSTSSRQFVLVLQVSFSQNFIFDDLISSLGSVTTKYGSYVLVTYNRILLNGSPMDSIDRFEFSSMDGIIDQLNRVKYTYAASDKQPIGKAVMTALGNKTNREDAVVFVLTDTDDASLDADVVAMKKATAQAGAPLHVIRTQQFGDSCPDFDDTKLASFARETGGVYVDTCAKGSSSDEIGKAMSGLASRPTSAQLVDVQQHFNEDCSDANFTFVYRANADESLFVRVVSERTLVSEVSVIRLEGAAELLPTRTFTLNTLHEWTLPIEMGPLSIDRFEATVSVSSGGGCAVYLYALSPDSLWYSYGQMEKDATDRNAAFAEAIFPRLHIEGAEHSEGNPGADFYVYDMEGTQTYASTAGELRGNCSYELLWPVEMACPTRDGPYLVQASVSHFGYVIQRTWFAYCSSSYICVHGSHDGTKCVCYGGNYAGDYCEIPQCGEHGKADNGVCKCEKLYTGQFCEYAMCDAQNFWEAGDERTRDFRSVTFVLDLTNNAVTANLMIQDGIAGIVSSMDASGNAKQFNLITYDDEGVTFAASSSVGSFFVSEFNRVVTTANHKPTTPATTKAFSAIDQAMQLNVAQPNLIIAFVSSSSSPKFDEFTRMQNQHPGVQVNIIYTPKTLDPMLPSKTPYYLYEAATYMSGGRVIPSTQINAYYLPEVIKSMATEDVLLTAEGTSDCTKGFSSSFIVESTASRLIVLITGSGIDSSDVRVEVDGTALEYRVRKDLFWDSAAYSFEITAPGQYGSGATWKVTTSTSSGRCSVQARLQASIRTEMGFVSDVHDDFVHDLPFVGTADATHKETRLALSVSAQNAPHVTFTKASIYDFDFSTGKRTLKSEVAIGLRDYGGVSPVNPGCAYQYISEPLKLTTTYSAIVVSGKDLYYGESLQRTFIVSSNPQDCNGKQFKETGECICPQGFTGDDCWTALCSNGGSASGSVCICTSGYTGDHCEDIAVLTPTTKAPPTTLPTAPTVPPASDGPTEGAATATDEQEPVTTPTAPTTTKSLPQCYPDATSYSIAVFIENARFTYNTPDAAEGILKGLAAQYRLGVDLQRSRTAFMMTGVNKEYFYNGIQQSVPDISAAIDAIEGSLEATQANSFDLGNALTKFSAENAKELKESKPFALVFSGMASTDDASASLQSLIAADYTLIGVAFTDAAETYLRSLTDSTYRFTNDANEAAQFVVNVTCAVKPR